MRKILFLTFAAMITTLGCGGGRINDGATTDMNPGSIQTVGVKDFAKAISDTAHVKLVDVRTAKEFAEGHIASATNIDVNQPDFEQRSAWLTGDDGIQVAVYCRAGKRSMKAAESLSRRGVRVLNLDGGIMAWQREGKAIVK